jgi:hypothetical protein
MFGFAIASAKVAVLGMAHRPSTHPIEMPGECMGIAVACDAYRPDARPCDGQFMA